MNWIKQFVILFVFASGQLVQASVGTRSKLGLAETYGTCVSRNLSESSLFNEKDGERVHKIVLETRARMHELNGDPENARDMLRLFAAALACVVADCDSSVRPQREQVCLNALEACAKSLRNRTLETEIAKEMKRIFSAMNRELSHLDAISGNSAFIESKKKETRTEKKEKNLIDEKKKEIINHSEKESEAKKRYKRAYAPPFRFPSFSIPVQSNPTLDSVIANKLLNSATFNNFFKFGLSQADAVFFSRSMVMSGLSGFRYDITQETLNRVSSSLSRLGSFAGSDDYAYAIARSIASVLAAHNLTMFADGLDIADALIYQLDSLLGSDSGSESSISSIFGAVSVSSSDISSQIRGTASVQVNPSFVEPSFTVPTNPQNDKTLFQNRLFYFLTQSQTISETFCSSPVPGVYEIINSAFYDYGYSISSTIATIVSNSLSMLPTEAACAQYGEIISEIVADVLDKNGLIPTSDPLTITNAISDIISPNIQDTPLQNPSNFSQQTFSSSDYQLNPSFSDFSYSPEISASFINQDFDTTLSTSVPDTSLQKQIPTLINSTEFTFDASSVIQIPHQQDLPTELSSDDLIVKNDSWVVVDSTSDAALHQKFLNATALPVILEPGPVISVNIPNVKNAPELQMASTDKTTMPEMVDMTKSAEVTTPLPLSVNFPLSTTVAKSEVITSQVPLKNIYESSSQSPEFPMEEMTLKALNITIDVEKKQQNLQESSSDLNIQRAKESPPSLENSELIEKSSRPQDKRFLAQMNTEAPTSTETPSQQYRPSDDIALKVPKPITDEISALVLADKVSSIVKSSIGLIRSDKLEFEELCRKLNELAALVDLPPLTVFSEIPLIDYLLHVLNALTYSLAGEK